ncbi:uncharacterized protein TRAVEDRAFT_49273 [Trametes versicolor FP-101664 SS1]|uniref:uncharacterized protein n=1 Tax=Trametes versicolor (strain FP-101664) TaxID=717944 RepID=UPI0004622D27|nr:uncharacterized protein TRAVEDRAFT_49273 [Trametes versicolor FP-101664 SS1]EIW56449.1 hypothetical protein TRAVEDRAFT_49273 [Trametes versicolor FP-101664 SS1]
MNLLWLYRGFTFVLVSIISLVVIAFCAHTSTNLDKILAAFELEGSFPYTNLGIAVGAITIVSKVLLLALDFFIDNTFTSFIIFEISWSSILWILWISVGATTLSEGNTIFKGHTCDDFDVVLPAAKNICDDIHPIAIIAFVNAFLLFLYTGVLFFAAFTTSSSTPPWTTSLKNRNKF